MALTLGESKKKKKDDEEARSSYTPLDSSGNDYAGMAGVDDVRRAAIDGAKESWQRAYDAGDTEGMSAAHRQAEANRRLYGYSGGADGSQYLPSADFSYETAPSWASRYQSQIDDLTSSILGREAFSYDKDNDPLYQQYARSYTNAGNRAMEDTMGKAAAMTGGLASSYATTAGQQAYNQYMTALADKVPELQQLAYEMYVDEGNTQRNNLSMLQSLDNADYAKYADRLGQYNTDRSFDYGVFSDAWSRSNTEAQQEAEQARYDREYADSRADTWYDRQAAKAATLGASGDFSGYKALGYTDDEVRNMLKNYQEEKAAAAAKAASSSSKKSSKTGDSAVYNTMYKAGVRTEGDAYAWLIANDYSSGEAAKMAEYFTKWDPTTAGNHSENFDSILQGVLNLAESGQANREQIKSYLENRKKNGLLQQWEVDQIMEDYDA